MRYSNSGLVLAALVLSCWAPLTVDLPTPQDMQIAGHVLHFQQTPVLGAIVVAIVFNPADTRSHDEAAATAALLGNGLVVGDLILRPRLVEQAHLAEAGEYGAVFTTVAVDQALLGADLKKRQVPCLTRHSEQVEHGSCIVAICSQPSVSIVVNMQNAGLAGVHFATAFRMMVQEI